MSPCGPGHRTRSSLPCALRTRPSLDPRSADDERREMIDVLDNQRVASSLEGCPSSAKSGGGMARAWCRSTERRRGMATLLGVVAAALPGSREPKFLRQRFEQELRELLNAR